MAAGLEQVAARARADGLGAFHPDPADGTPDGCGTLVLVGPDGLDFWPRFAASPEMADELPDPLDRWSERVVGKIAEQFGALALFPFGGPPWQPFTAWARRSGRAWISPVGLLVHDRLGLWVSYRGALALPHRLALPDATAPRPCDACPQPCRTACPAGALVSDGYDVAACHGWLASPAGGDCLSQGCRVRSACPLGAGSRSASQSAFHMAAFHGTEFRCDA